MPRGVKKTPKLTGESVSTKTLAVSPTYTEEIEDTSVQTKEQQERSSAPLLEKTKDSEKDTAPTILITWNDASGKRISRTYTCADIKIREDKSESVTKAAGKKTTIDLCIEAQVLDISTR